MDFKNYSIAGLLAILCLTSFVWDTVEAYQVGLGRADITGPPVEINFVSNQVGHVNTMIKQLKSFIFIQKVEIFSIKYLIKICI